MGKEVRGVPSNPPVESVGRYLARERGLRGISIDDLAVLTKIPRRSLERLEAGAFDRVPDGFARGFVRAVAGALGLDPDEAVLRLLAEPPEEDASGVLAAARRRLALVLGVGVALAAAGFGLWNLRSLWVGPDPPLPSDQIVYRRDAVRSLAAEHRERPPLGWSAPPVEPAPAEPPEPAR